MKKIFYKICLLIIALSISKINVLADSVSVTKGSTALVTTTGGYHVYQKTVGGKNAYCLDGVNVVAPDSGTYTPTVTSGSCVYGYLIQNTQSKGYLYTELAILKASNGTLDDAVTKAGYTDTSLNTDVENANTYCNSFNSSFNVNTSASALTFSYSNYNNLDIYVSEPITVSGLNNISGNLNITAKLNGNTVSDAVVLNGNQFYVKFAYSTITADSTVSVTISATQTKNYKSTIYNFGSSYQKLVVDSTGDPATSSKTLSGNITKHNKTYKVIIKKVDSDGNGVEGAILDLKDSSKNSKGSWNTKDNNLREFDLEPGKYTLSETTTPDGYKLSSSKVIEVKEDGSIYYDSKKITGNTISYVNELNQTKIKKINSVDGNLLEGAKLQILDKDKKEISCKYLDSNKNVKTLDKCTWTSTDDVMIILGLNNGDKYYLKELEAPSGYSLNEDLVEFEIKEDGSTIEVEMENNLEVEVPDTLSAKSSMLVAFAMFDIALGIGLITYVKKNKLQQ